MTALRATSLRHVRPVVPLRFPAQEPDAERMGQSKRHREICAAFYQRVKHAVGREHAKGADPFVYFDAANPRRRLAPDLFVKLRVRDRIFDSWKVWELGTPEVAVEIVSPSDTPERWTFREKLKRYRQLGLNELVFCNLDARPGKRLRVWDRLDGDLVERVVDDDRSPCLTLGLYLLVGPVNAFSLGLRLGRDPVGRVPLLSLSERVAAKDEELAEAKRRAAALDAKLRRARKTTRKGVRTRGRT